MTRQYRTATFSATKSESRTTSVPTRLNKEWNKSSLNLLLFCQSIFITGLLSNKDVWAAYSQMNVCFINYAIFYCPLFIHICQHKYSDGVLVSSSSVLLRTGISKNVSLNFQFTRWSQLDHHSDHLWQQTTVRRWLWISWDGHEKSTHYSAFRSVEMMNVCVEHLKDSPATPEFLEDSRRTWSMPSERWMHFSHESCSVV